MTRRTDRCALLVLLATTVATGAFAQSGTGAFVLFSNQGIRARGLDVHSGDVGANVDITATRPLEAATSRVVAPFVALDPKSVCEELDANGGQAAPACGPAKHVSTPIIADVAAACGLDTPLPTTCPPGPAITIGHMKAPIVKGPGTYGAVTIAGGGHGPGTLVLTAGTYTFCSLKLSRNAKLLARGPVTINVIGNVRLENGSTVGPETSALDSCDVRVFAGGSVRISRKAHMTARLCAPHSRLELTVGAQLTGSFFANDVKTDRVHLTVEPCATSTTSSTTTSTTHAPGSSSTSTSSSTTTTTPNTLCGNGIVDPGEPCDPSSPTGAFNCPEGDTCSSDCTCLAPTSTSTSTSTSTTNTSSTVTTSSTSSTVVLQTTTTSGNTTSSTSSSTVPTTSSTSIIPTTSSTSIIPTTSSTSTSTSTTTTTTMPSVTFDSATAFDFLSTAGGGSCGNTFRDLAGTIPLKKLICGNLSLGGGLSQVPDNVTPSGATNRFTLSCSANGQCTVGATQSAGAGFDCTTTGCRFGTPLPISNAGLSVCVENTYAQPVSGTLNRNDGSATMNFQLSSKTILTGIAAQPCPICRIGTIAGNACAGTPAAPCTGVCEGSANQGATCTSLNPNGLTGGCPAPAAVSGQNRCYKGTNNGNPCTLSGDCPGGSCAQFVGNIPISLNPLTTGTTSLSASTGQMCPGQGVNQKGAFKSDICQTGANSGKPCTSATAAADCGAGVACRAGTNNNYCNGGTNDGHGCVINTDCGTGGVCTKAGTLAELAVGQGTTSGLLQHTGVAQAMKLASVFCVPATGVNTVDANANLPGPGATVLVGTIKLIP